MLSQLDSGVLGDCRNRRDASWVSIRRCAPSRITRAATCGRNWRIVTRRHDGSFTWQGMRVTLDANYQSSSARHGWRPTRNVATIGDHKGFVIRNIAGMRLSRNMSGSHDIRRRGEVRDSCLHGQQRDPSVGPEIDPSHGPGVDEHHARYLRPEDGNGAASGSHGHNRERRGQ